MAYLIDLDLIDICSWMALTATLSVSFMLVVVESMILASSNIVTGKGFLGMVYEYTSGYHNQYVRAFSMVRMM